MFKNKGRIVATIEARMTSSRLPGKVLMDFCGKPNLQHIVERLKRSKYIDEVVVATTTNKEDDPIIELCKKICCKYYRGSEEDVLLRVVEAAKSVNAKYIIEITGDCPVIDWRHSDQLVKMFFSSSYDYASNIIERSFPRGFDTQIFPVEVLDEVNRITRNPVDHEHVSIYIYTHPEKYKLLNWKADEKMNHPEFEITLDTKEDYQFIKEIYETLYPQNEDFSAEDVVNLLIERPKMTNILRNNYRKDPFKEQKEWEENHGQKV
ncbi:cytidylyltransferase family protein [Clostridium sporogenes]|uniref:cytidylyltransferase domain-containing protein n=1 Tax=Clostridium TaxID=1485 RepID=UPI00090A556A|nr:MULTISPECIES: glycosyltransferase family protein [Clostridium]APF27311.1 cytidylyltransferase family protein [Clostridium sporogenes]MDI6919521.1 glycosyltransferase family protein [Clostridium botulinum]WMU96771.1 glycosyltransferase family protein [Clostridium botulinum]